jgi:Right handed beta helix region
MFNIQFPFNNSGTNPIFIGFLSWYQFEYAILSYFCSKIFIIMPFRQLFRNNYSRVLKGAFSVYFFLMFLGLGSSSYSMVFQDTIRVLEYGEIPKPIIIEGKKDILILGMGFSTSSGYKTFNNHDYLIRIINSENVTIRNLILGFGIKNIGKATIKIESSKNITIEECAFKPYSEFAVLIDKPCRDIHILKSSFEGSHNSAIQTSTANVEIIDNSFKNNNALGSIRGDIEENYDYKLALAQIRSNHFDQKSYKSHKDAMQDFVALKESTSYRFNSFKIVKKIELGTGESGKLTAYFEGENNKILDLLGFSTGKRSGYLGGKIYLYQKRPVMCQVRSGQREFENFWFVYGNLIEGEKIQGKDHFRTPIDFGNDAKKIEEEWYSIKDLWLDLIEREEEKFSFETPLGILSHSH